MSENLFEKVSSNEIWKEAGMPTPIQKEQTMSEKEEWEHKPIGVAELQTVPKAKLILTLDRAHRAEEKLDTITRTMNNVIMEKCDLDAFYKNVYFAWGDLKLRYFTHLISNDERIAAIRQHLKATDVGSQPWLTMLDDLVNLGVGAAQSQESGLVRETSKSEVPG